MFIGKSHETELHPNC